MYAVFMQLYCFMVCLVYVVLVCICSIREDYEQEPGFYSQDQEPEFEQPASGGKCP